eukprot:CAMPEP_0113487840 /NCGR_PEP_ID=MMETSP0014_2-20120614/25711_1 /TAXON_ID=2857 /ORGANISM="Nitzschia sp." /LENGTH=280 /DNA_ID=CAMNT_0000381539 /DNA_START=159 /DNA_END=1001 /DNA_ORIENTATION=+ /assembly_acc=CAM_ASM_000159
MTDTNKDGSGNDLIHISSHPVLTHKISIMRSATTEPEKFRSTLKEVTYHLGYEATKGIETREVPLTVSHGKESAEEHIDCTGYKITTKVALIPILRSGLGMCDSMLQLLPAAAVHHIGMYRIPGHQPVQYFNRLPKKCDRDMAIVLDPIIGSSATILAVINILKKWGVPKIRIVSVLASKQGLDSIKAEHPDVYVTVGMVDQGLTKDGIVVPGMGDCGDRLFGTISTDESIQDDGTDTTGAAAGDQDLVLHQSKRKRGNSIDLDNKLEQVEAENLADQNK